MRRSHLLVIVCSVFIAAGCATTKVQPKVSAKLPVNKDVKVPNDTQLTVYIPKSTQESRFFSSAMRRWITPGRDVTSGTSEVLSNYFSQVQPYQADAKQSFGLLLALHPDIKVSDGNMTLTMRYRLYDAQGTELLKGEQVQKESMQAVIGGVGFYNAAVKSTQQLVVKLLNTLQPNAEKYSPTGLTSAIAKDKLAYMAEATKTGTGFFINEQGQLVTAAHVLRDCLVVKAETSNSSELATELHQSALLDISVLSSNLTPAAVLPIRAGEEITLGEPLVNVGYPLQGVLSQTPNLTRGNISAEAGLTGSKGHFQFSAPIQPGNSGGPLVSDSGQLLGMTVSTLNSSYLIEKGVVPQNVNFALDRQYISKFLTKHQVPFTVAAVDHNGNFKKGNDAALNSVVKLSCYE